jgi:hypothetical protein
MVPHAKLKVLRHALSDASRFPATPADKNNPAAPLLAATNRR